MRAVPAAFAAYQYARSKEPIIAVEIAFNAAGTDLVYITSADDVPLPVGVVAVVGCLAKVSSTSQTITPDEGRSTIGTIKFELIDKAGAFSAILKAKDDVGAGIRYKRVRVYQGFRGMDWAGLSANLIQTQIIDDLNYNEGVYQISCADIQRTARQNIFVLATTNLSTNVTASQMLIPVRSVDGFSRVAHGATYSDSPSSEVGYIKVDDEVIRWTGTTVDSTYGLCFVVGARGVLGTRAAAHTVDTSSSSDQQNAVSEFVYLELPAIKLAYAILTGNLYGQAGKRLPSGWHLNIPSSYVRTSDFISIGSDVWDASNDDGLVVRFAGEESQDGKQFIEKQLCLLSGTFMPVYSSGELGLRRFTSILQEAPHVFEINDSNAVKYSALQTDIKSVFNLLSIEWNYDHLEQKLTRQKILIDTVSRTKYEATPPKSLQFNGLHGSRHTTTTVEGLFNRLRDRYASPPQRIKIRCLPFLNVLEVGDIVRVKTSGVRDYFRSTQSLDRSFEVQRVSVDWLTGQVDVDLFGSTHAATIITPSAPGGGNPDNSLAVLPDSYYTSAGVNLATYSGITSTLTGGVRHITGGSGIVGNDLLQNGRYYHNGDLELNSGVTLNFTKNVLLVVKGHLQINGKFDGKGRGQAGGVAPTPANPAVPPFPPAGYSTYTPGVPGFIGPTISGGGTANYIQFGKHKWHWVASRGYQSDGAVTSVPLLALSVDGSGSLAGLPANAQGASGASGHHSWNEDTHSNYYYSKGGNGGNGGAALVIVARGVSFGASGVIDASGTDGTAGTPNGILVGGAGAGGAPGAVIIIIDGLSNEVPSLTGVASKFGASPLPSVPYTAMSGVDIENELAVGQVMLSYFTGYGAVPPDLSGYAGGSRVLYVPPTNAPSEDVPKETLAANFLALNELINTPPTIDKSLSTIEVTVTRPDIGNYSYSNIYYRKSGASAWVFSGPASDEWDFAVPADGSTYEVLARPVSIADVESQAGITQSITTTSAVSSVPLDIRDIHTNYRNGFVEVYWAAISDVRGIDYEIRLGASWSASVVLGQTSVNNFTANQAGTYWIAARIIGLDGQVIYSLNPQSVVISNGYIVSNVIAAYDEFVSGLPGTLGSGAIIVSSKIRLNGTANILASTDFLAETNVLGAGSYVASGTYEASTHVVNIGREAPCLVSIAFAAHNEDANNNAMDAALTNVKPQINVGNNAGTYAGWQDYKPGTYFGRYFKARVMLESLDGTATPVVTALSFSIDVPDRLDDGSITTLTTGPVTLTHSPAFNGGNGPSNVPIVSANIISGSAGDQLFITSISTGAVSFEVKNAGASVARSVHYSIQGY